jgi:hypothetical protein
MSESTVVGSVAGIWLFRVKSMKGEKIEQGRITRTSLSAFEIDKVCAEASSTTGICIMHKHDGMYIICPALISFPNNKRNKPGGWNRVRQYESGELSITGAGLSPLARLLEG